jgi:predicted DNA-binding transcriptional regulator AlpA
MKHSESKSAQVRKMVAENPMMSAKEIATQTGFTIATVYNAMSKARKKATKPKKMGRPKKIDVEIKERNAKADMQHMLHSISQGRGKMRMGRPPMRMMGVFTSNTSISDVVNHPAHYKVGGIETIDFIEAKKLSYNLGNVVKYITRADHKGNRKEDLLKAQWYLNREIANLTK